MSDGLTSFCDDLYVDLYVNTQLELPSQRDTVLAFFERVQKQYPSMGNFRRRGENEYCLEEDQSSGRYRWVALDVDRLASGMVNPVSFDDAYDQHKLVLELAPYMLSLSHLDIDSLDVAIAMEFNCRASHDEVIAEAFFNSSAFTCLMDLPEARPISFSPGFVFALSEDCHTQARISIESKTSIFDPRKVREPAEEEPITLSLTVRQFPRTGKKFDPVASFTEQCKLAEELMEEKIIPNFVRPLLNVIEQRKFT